MVNWKDIHPGFIPELQKQWERWSSGSEKTFPYEQVKEWIAVGLTPHDDEFAAFCINNDWKPKNLNKDNLEEKRKDYNGWKNIKDTYPNFAYHLQKLWKKHKFTAEQAQQWINAGLTPYDADFANCLKRKGYNPKQELNLNQLRKKYQHNLDWRGIHEDFGKVSGYYRSGPPGETVWARTYQQEWEKNNLTYQDAQELIPVGFKPEDYFKFKQWKKLNFTAQQTKKWVNIGLKPQEVEFAFYLQQNNYQPQQISNLAELKEKYHDAQSWLDFWYPKEGTGLLKADTRNYNKTRQQITGLSIISKQNPQGSLNLAGFIKLKTLHLGDNQLTNLNFLNDLNEEKLTTLNISNNKIISDLTPFSKFIKLKTLCLDNNLFYGSLQPLQGMAKLKRLNISNTDLDGGLEYLPKSVRKLECLADQRKDAKCRTIYNLFANEQGEVETKKHRRAGPMGNEYIKNFPQKLQEYKQKMEQFNQQQQQQNLTNNFQEKSILILQWEGVDIENNSCELFSVVAGSKEENLSFGSTFFANTNYQNAFQREKIYKLAYTGELEKDSSVVLGIEGNFIFEDITDTQFIKEIWKEKEQAEEKITLLEKENNLLRQQLKKQSLTEQIKAKLKAITQSEQQLNNLSFSEGLQEGEKTAQIIQPTYGILGSSKK